MVDGEIFTTVFPPPFLPSRNLHRCLFSPNQAAQQPLLCAPVTQWPPAHTVPETPGGGPPNKAELPPINMMGYGAFPNGFGMGAMGGGVGGGMAGTMAAEPNLAAVAAAAAEAAKKEVEAELNKKAEYDATQLRIAQLEEAKKKAEAAVASAAAAPQEKGNGGTGGASGAGAGAKEYTVGKQKYIEACHQLGLKREAGEYEAFEAWEKVHKGKFIKMYNEEKAVLEKYHAGGASGEPPSPAAAPGAGPARPPPPAAGATADASSPASPGGMPAWMRDRPASGSPEQKDAWGAMMAVFTEMNKGGDGMAALRKQLERTEPAAAEASSSDVAANAAAAAAVAAADKAREEAKAEAAQKEAALQMRIADLEAAAQNKKDAAAAIAAKANTARVGAAPSPQVAGPSGGKRIPQKRPHGPPRGPLSAAAFEEIKKGFGMKSLKPAGREGPRRPGAGPGSGGRASPEEDHRGDGHRGRLLQLPVGSYAAGRD